MSKYLLRCERTLHAVVLLDLERSQIATSVLQDDCSVMMFHICASAVETVLMRILAVDCCCENGRSGKLSREVLQ